MEDNTQIDSLNIKEKIKIEKRKRTQVYAALDYLKSHTNKFDFFSFDSIQILRHANTIAKKFNQEKVSSEFLLLGFLSQETEFLTILEKFNISKEILENYFVHIYASGTLKNKKIPFFSDLKKENFSTDKIEYNFEVKTIIQKVIENSFRFKTPVITPEILFLTLLEEKNLSSGFLLQKILKNDVQWNLLRYEILKKIHYQETMIQGNISKSYRYFAYLLKLELNNDKFEKLLEKKEFSLAIQAYRDLVVSKILQFNLFELLEQEIKISLVSNNIRKYSII
jgi:hypothetical protein